MSRSPFRGPSGFARVPACEPGEGAEHQRLNRRAAARRIDELGQEGKDEQRDLGLRTLTSMPSLKARLSGAALAPT
jgi:hypothetical protein